MDSGAAGSQTPDTKNIASETPTLDLSMVATAVHDPSKVEPEHEKDAKEKQLKKDEEHSTPTGGAGARVQDKDSPIRTLARHAARVDALEELVADMESSMVKVEGGARQGVRAMKIIEKVREEMAENEGLRDEEAEELQLLKTKCEQQEKMMIEIFGRLQALESDKREKTPGRRTPRTGGRMRGSPTGDDEHEAEDEWDRESTTSDANKSLGITFFTASEIDTLTCDMKRAEIIDKVQELREDLKTRHPVVEEILEMTDKDYEAAIELESEEGAEFRAADAFIRRACRAIIKGKTDEIKIWKSKERALREEVPAKARLGRRMLERMESFGSLTAPDDVRDHKKHLTDNMDYLTVGMTKVQAKAGAERVREEWAMLPEKDRAAIDLRRLLCSKVPREIEGDASRTFGERLEDEIDEAERRGRTVDTFDQLADVIAGRIAKARRPTALVTTKKGQERCHNCDELDCEGWSTCTVRCKTVDWLKGCTCCRGEECVMAMETLPAQKDIPGKRRRDGKSREMVRDATYELMKKKHAEMKAAKAGGETPKATVGAVVTSPLVF
jgi:hypothetical protein